MRTLRFGLRLVQHLAAPRDLIRYATLAEAAGFDQVWFSHDPFLQHAWALASAAAERTRRVGIGVLGTNPYTLDPCEIAAWAATLDELSEGRALLGLGLHTGEMVEWVGHNAWDLIPRTREAVALVRRLWAGEVVANEEPNYPWRWPLDWTPQAYLRFTPRRPRIPIYVCAFGDEYLGLAGEIGDGALPMITPPEAASLMVERVHAGARAAGRDPGEIDIAGCAWLSLAEDPAAATERLRPLIAYFGPYLEEPSLATIGLGQADFAPLKRLAGANRLAKATAAVTPAMLRLGIVGTPDDVVRAIERLIAAGITQVNLGGPLGPDPEAAIRLMGERVIPRFRSS